jgi:hypothetical protein
VCADPGVRTPIGVSENKGLHDIAWVMISQDIQASLPLLCCKGWKNGCIKSKC